LALPDLLKPRFKPSQTRRLIFFAGRGLIRHPDAPAIAIADMRPDARFRPPAKSRGTYFRPTTLSRIPGGLLTLCKSNRIMRRAKGRGASGAGPTDLRAGFASPCQRLHTPDQPRSGRELEILGLVVAMHAAGDEQRVEPESGRPGHVRAQRIADHQGALARN